MTQMKHYDTIDNHSKCTNIMNIPMMKTRNKQKSNRLLNANFDLFAWTSFLIIDLM